MPLPHGVYEALLDENLRGVLQEHPELRSIFGKLDPEEEPSRYAMFVAKVFEHALRLETDPLVRLRLCNEVIERITGTPEVPLLILVCWCKLRNPSSWRSRRPPMLNPGLLDLKPDSSKVACSPARRMIHHSPA
jgi:hypothetical protein